jgi:hypothetical protein
MVNLRKKYDVLCTISNCVMCGNLKTYDLAQQCKFELELEYGNMFRIIPTRETRTALQRVLAECIIGKNNNCYGYGLYGHGNLDYIIRQEQNKCYVDIYRLDITGTYTKEGTYTFNTEDECLAFINGCERGEEI